ncbi:MAG: hypothetical protein PVJ39_15740 [Gammaproteobacteria bacterium]|jgi:hypothetical protein
MQNQHPSTERLANYLDAPESTSYGDVRRHLMGCHHCRVRVDQLTQLELDIKHYAPRFSQPETKTDNTGQTLERYLDGEMDNEPGHHQQHIEKQIMSDPAALKAALHYTLHSSTMRRDLEPASGDLSERQPTHSTTKPNIANRLLHCIKRQGQQPIPLWAMAAATLVLAIAVGWLTKLNDNPDNAALQIATFQDDPTITFQRGGPPAGSIGFFHDAQTRRKAFQGMTITVTGRSNLTFSWPAITGARHYELQVYTIKDNNKRVLAESTSAQPSVTIEDIGLQEHQHYHWQLSGKTGSDLAFTTQGDFLYMPHQ